MKYTKEELEAAKEELKEAQKYLDYVKQIEKEILGTTKNGN